MEGVIEGRQVHYVMTGKEPAVEPHTKGQHRAATIVRVWGDSPQPGYVNLLVHVDGFNDYVTQYNTTQNYLALIPQLWVTSVHFSAEKEEGTWHFIEYAGTHAGEGKPHPTPNIPDASKR